eukprot:1426101-Pyramimonas_sp.AAC.1
MMIRNLASLRSAKFHLSVRKIGASHPISSRASGRGLIRRIPPGAPGGRFAGPSPSECCARG